MLLDRHNVIGSRRAELADLLRLRRHAFKSIDVEIAARRLRRTPGLRREEVAELAGISCSMYTALEQGRDIPVSAATIEAIARALRLTESERLHALVLIQRTRTQLRETVSPRLHRFVTLSATPMYVLDHVWDMVLVNAPAAALFDLEMSDDPAQRGNALRRAYLDPRTRALFSDGWRTMARSSTEAFRLATAQQPSDPHTIELIARLLEQSPEFAEDWKEHGVREHPRDAYRLTHPKCGAITIEPSAYAVLESPDLRIMAFTLTDRTSAEKIACLAKDLVSVPALLST